VKIIGLTGGTGAGKGTVAALFSKYNFAHIDTDAIYHELTSGMTPCLVALSEEFGKEIVKDGALDRAALASVVFKCENRQRLARLNEIAHKFVLDEVRARISRLSGYDAVLVDAPVLFESGFDRECDSILCIIARKDVRIGRIMERDGITYERAEARIAAQRADEELIALSDFVIENNGDTEALEKEVERVATVIRNNKF
jgi:dephospho-CoA kinase